MKKVNSKAKKHLKLKLLGNDNETDRMLKHYLGAIGEQYNENLKAINENNILVNLRIDKVDSKMDRMERTLDLHTKILDSHTKTLASHTEMISDLLKDTTEIKDDLKTKVSYSEFALLVKRVQKLELSRS